MRVYTAKPRTNGDGYKGLIHQPDAAGAPDLIAGIRQFAICTTELLQRLALLQLMKCFILKMYL